jgi:uncharacterized protein (TIGR03435 family)
MTIASRTLGCILALAAAAVGQPAKQTFEAADVHTSTSTSDDFGFLANGRVEVRGVTMLRLIASAYSVPTARISGGPSWLDTDRFDITAKAASSSASPMSMRNMLQSLLAERFHLEIKNEEKAMPAFVLTLVKKGVAKPSDGKGDPGCKRTADEEGAALTCHNTTMASLADLLPQTAPGYFSLTTVDHTGLTGGFDFQLRWKGRQQITSSTAPESLYTSLEKQLGVKAEQQTTPLPVTTVVSVDRTPTPNAPNVSEELGKTPTEFDVVNIHLSRPDEKEDFRLANGRIDAKAVLLRDMITFAYDVEDDWVRGGEKWIETDRYDIVAKTQPTESSDTLRVMVQSMLADRFKLKVHKEAQPVTVYALTVSKSKLQEANPNSRSTCVRSAVDGGLSLACTNTTMAQFATKIRDVAPGYLEHPVVDLTGLQGGYDFTVSWAPKNRVMGPGRPGEAAASADSAVPVALDRPAGLTLYEAISRQLGLKLATQKHPMQVVVIDHMERTPTEN